MKKIYIILICIIISISFVSCTSSSKEKNNSNSISFTQKTTESNQKANNSKAEQNVTAKPLDDGSNIEKVKLSFFNSAQESTYDESAKKLIESIKACKDNKDIK